jgi:outer membrane protein OmpA-like peptidoglycan-associated protein
MRRASASDHLAHSFTDLMTSLMVIFILLLLVFMNNQASVNTVTAQSLMADLRQQLEPAGFKREDIRIDPADPSTILLTLLDAQLTFLPNSHRLQPEGEKFLATRMPKLAAALCDDRYRGAVEAVVIEGHSDSVPYRGLSPQESQARNLKLSQERSMEVVEKTLTDLSDNPASRSCLLEKISASGRGEQDLAETADKSRRAVIKIRVNSSHAPEFANAINAGHVPVPPPPVPTPAALRILDITARLQAVPHQQVSFRLSEDEVNQYLVYALLRTPRPGISSVSVRFFPHDYVSTLTMIDFDDIERWSPGLVPGFFGLSGKRTVWIDFRFSSGNGTVALKIEKAFYQDKSLPHFLAEKIVQTLGARQPEGFGTDDEMMLPFGLRRVHTGQRYIEAEDY